MGILFISFITLFGYMRAIQYHQEGKFLRTGLYLSVSIVIMMLSNNILLGVLILPAIVPYIIAAIEICVILFLYKNLKGPPEGIFNILRFVLIAVVAINFLIAITGTFDSEFIPK